MSAMFRAPLMGSALAACMAVSIAACSSTPAGEEGSAAPVPDAVAGCDAAAAQSAVGKQATAEVVEQARNDAGARTTRVIKPGQAVTMDYRGDRLNLYVDAKDAITSATCG